MPFVIESSDIPDVVPQQEWYLNVICDLYPAHSNSQFRRMSARLKVDNVELPIREWTYSEDLQTLAGTLNVTLAHHSDRTAITRTASIKFETAEWNGVSFDWSTLVDTASLSSSDYNLQNNGLIPNDSFTLTATPLLQARLDTSPMGTVVLYDPERLTVNEEDFISIPDISGVENLVTITPITDLSLYSALEYVADVCGFAGVQPHIQDFPLRRVDFQPGEPYWGAIAGTMGMFEPILEIDADDNLVIRDGTADAQPDSDAALELTVDDITALQNSSDIKRTKGILLTYQEDGLGYDYWNFDIQTKDRYWNDIAGQYPYKKTEFWVQRFYRNAFPNTPVFTRLRKQKKWVYDVGNVLIAGSADLRNYNSFGQVTDREKRVFARQKAPQSWATFSATLPGPGFDSSFSGAEVLFTSASDATFVTATVLRSTEKETATYLAHPYEPDSIYLAHREIEQRGLIVIDSDNPQLEEDFEQPLMRAQRAGNLASGQGSRWGTTGTRTEGQRPLKNRQVDIQTDESDALNADGESLLPEDYEDPRVGDIGISVIKQVTKQLYITEGGDPTATLWEKMNGGEVPLSILQPLAIRKNRRQFYPANVQFSLAGIHRDLTRGRAVKLSDRQGNNFGTFRITSRSMHGETRDLSSLHTTSCTARQIV